jgi:geranylgeranyl reductase
VLVLERNADFGIKVCAGGITWDGLLRVVPQKLIERSFTEQYVFSNLQRVVVREKNPIIATISRRTLGEWMAARARESGADILTSMRVTAIHGNRVTTVAKSGETRHFTCDHLVGADGANSMVRHSLGIPNLGLGPGINYQLPRQVERMEWHLNTKFFGYGYGWVFPHRDTVSIGAYGPRGNMPAAQLKQNLLLWAKKKGYELEKYPCRAALISYDYQGHAFGTTWLVGDAAGLASGLTGEGIYPAIVSGEAVARQIMDTGSEDMTIGRMVKKQQLHHRVIRLSSRHPLFCSLLMEWLIMMLRLRLINFHTLEMAVADRNQS